jgi:hypothetical protein
VLEWVRRQFRHAPGHVDERTEALRSEAMLFGWVIEMTGLSAALLYRLLVLGPTAPPWWDFALAVQAGFWLAAVLFAVRSRWVIHAAVPLGASVAGVCLATVFTGMRLGGGPARCIAAGLISAPLWYVSALWAMFGLRQRIPGDERIETVRRQAVTVGGVVLSAAIIALLLLRVLLGRIAGYMDLWLLWFLPAALAGWLYRLWGGYTEEAHAAATRSLPRALVFLALFWVVAFYLISRDWARSIWSTVGGLAGISLCLRVRPRGRDG